MPVPVELTLAAAGPAMKSGSTASHKAMGTVHQRTARMTSHALTSQKIARIGPQMRCDISAGVPTYPQTAGAVIR